MGYTTSFTGRFDLDKQLSLDDFMVLKKREENYDRGDTEKGEPDSYCQWVPTEDGRGIEWNTCEKFYLYEEWLQWLIDSELKPKGYVLSGQIAYQGEETGDCGMLVIKNGKVATEKFTAKDSSIDELVKKALDDDEDRAYWYIEQIAEKMDIN